MPNDDRQDHVFRFIPLKEVDSSATFGEVATPKVLHDYGHQVVDRQKHACFFCAVSEPCTELKCPVALGPAVMISVDFDLDVVLRTQILLT